MPWRRSGGNKFQGHLRREQSAAEIHEHENAVGRPHLLNGSRHLQGIGPEHIPRLVQAAGDGDARPPPADRRGELCRAFGELRAVADENKTDHDEASASAAALIRSHVEVAPGS